MNFELREKDFHFEQVLGCGRRRKVATARALGWPYGSFALRFRVDGIEYERLHDQVKRGKDDMLISMTYRNETGQEILILNK